jgi:4-hydroxy-tetrahydrodipicolinate synthase
MFEGTYTALVTPFKNGNIDYSSLEKIIEDQITNGIDGIVPAGTTGESPTISFEEHMDLIKRVVEVVNKRVRVIAGTGSNSTDEAVHLSKSAQGSGVDGIMIVSPYYNKPTQKGLIEHFDQVAKAVRLPVVVYNIPSRTGVNFHPESVKELIDRAGNVIAIKEASGDITQMMRVIELCGDRLTLLSGDDNMLLPVLSIGGKGIISVLSNILPGDVKKVTTLFNSGKYDDARKAFYKLLPLCRSMFLETNPIPIKAAMELLGRCTSEMRLPMTRLSPQYRELLKKSLVDYGFKV